MLSTLFTLALSSVSLVAALPVDIHVRQSVGFTTDFPDPSVIFVDGTWYTFASQSGHDNQGIRVQLAQSTDFVTWTLQEGYDAMPTLPPWASPTREVWAPDINRLADGTFILYFSAGSAANPGKHCVGTARSPSVRGPFIPDPSVFDCNIAAGGSIDASGFADTDGTRYVVWKLDGNSLGHGGPCGNSIAPVVSTPIVIQQVAADGATKIGAQSTLIANDPIDGPDVEGPAMIKNAGSYVLFFSSNCYSTPLYDTSYAYSSSPTGGFVKSDLPLFVTGDLGMTGPGGVDVTVDGARMVMHSLQPDGRRVLRTTSIGLQVGEGKVRIN
ncbi:hypothetical protein ANO11243_016020 [Dothideomycetidae sp. 11243]|nr:hypothetical protein ANO11243_016020 [fungal sp. No.11243]